MYNNKNDAVSILACCFDAFWSTFSSYHENLLYSRSWDWSHKRYIFLIGLYNKCPLLLRNPNHDDEYFSTIIFSITINSKAIVLNCRKFRDKKNCLLKNISTALFLIGILECYFYNIFCYVFSLEIFQHSWRWIFRSQRKDSQHCRYFICNPYVIL
jgi:hypothetical protein